jgi:hypothetical protein
MNCYILNTRTGGQNPNVLGADFKNRIFTPQLAVSTDGKVPHTLVSSSWELVQFEPGLYYLQILSPEGTPYVLAVNAAISSTTCELISYKHPNFKDYNAIWAFPYPGQPRIILIYSASKEKALSLDAGHYPDVMIWDFVSSVNQTWEFSIYEDPFKPSPNPPFEDPK